MKLKNFKFVAMLLVVLGLAACSKKSDDGAVKFDAEKSTISGDDASAISYAGDQLQMDVIESTSKPGTFTVLIKVPVKLNSTVDASSFAPLGRPKLSLLDEKSNPIVGDQIIFGLGQVDTQSETEFIEFLKKQPGATFDMPFNIYANFADKETAEKTIKDISGKLKTIKMIDVAFSKNETDASAGANANATVPTNDTPAAAPTPNQKLLDDFDQIADEFIMAVNRYGVDSPEVYAINERSIDILDKVEKANLTPEEKARYELTRGRLMAVLR